MRILLLTRPSNFAQQIVKLFYDFDNSFKFSVLAENCEVNHLRIGFFENIIGYKINFDSLVFFAKRIFKFLLYFFQSIYILLLDFRQGLKSITCVWDAFIYVAKIQHANIGDFDVVNVHYINIKRAIAALFLPADSHIVISFWGSDLMRTSGLANYFWLRKALIKSKVIHVSTIEMQEILLSKFGHELKNKIKFALFVPEFSLLKSISQLERNSDKVNYFKEKLKVPISDYCLVVGNNGNRGNNHLEILHELQGLKNENFTIIMPLTYALDKEYESQLNSFREKNPNMKIRMITNFLTTEELAIFRLISDIYVTMQETDAMSGALTETLYAGNICITASWLPYRKLKQNNIYHIECDSFKGLVPIIDNVLDNMEDFKLRTSLNRPFVEDCFYNIQELIQSWANIFKI